MALRQTLARMGRTVASSGVQTTAFRAFGASAMRGAEEGTSTMAAFMDKFVATAPSTLDKPFTPTDFMPEKKEAPAVTPEKLTLSMYMPHKIEFNASEVDMVLLPAVSGDFGVLPGHVSTVAQLRPGVVSVHLDDKDVRKYFVSSGFAFVHADSTADICAVEAVPLEELDGEAVKKGLAEYQSKLVNAKDDYEKAAAQIGVEVTGAMASALGQ